MDDATISWTVILSLGTIVGLFFTVGKPIINLNSTITELITRLKRMESDLDEFKTHNHEAHKKIHERIDTVEDDVENIKRDVIMITK